VKQKNYPRISQAINYYCHYFQRLKCTEEFAGDRVAILNPRE